MTPPIYATEETRGAGGLTYWSLSGDVSPQALAAVWGTHNLPEEKLPEPPSATVAFSRAVKEQQGKRRLVRRTSRGYAIVNERLVDKDEDQPLEYQVELEVWLNAAGQVEADYHCEVATQIRTAYEHHLENCSAEDIGSWLCRLVRGADGVSLRDSGGFYFVPPDRLEAWRSVMSALSAVSAHHVYIIPAMRSEDAVAAILAAVQAEATAEADIVEADLAGELGVRALNTRDGRLADVEAKVGRYEALLGVTLEALREKLGALRAGVSAALLRAMAEEANG